MRVLFFNEGNAGSIMMGHAQTETRLRETLAEGDSVEPRFASLAPLTGAAGALATRRIPLASDAGFDLPTLRWHVVQSLRARRAVDRELAAAPVDALCVQTQAVAFAMGAIARRLPLLLSIDATVEQWWSMPHHGPLSRRSERTVAPSRALERRIFGRSAMVLPWTRWALEGARESCPGARIVQHHPGLDIERYRPAAREHGRLPRVLFVGGRFAAKGGEDLLAAIGDLAGRQLEIDVVTPEEQIEAPGVTVHRLGADDPALVRLYQEADLLALPTWGDTNPWVILEALACETPVVASRIGAIPELLDGERAGTLVDPGDRRAIREAVQGLLAAPERRAAMARAGRELCERRYDSRVQIARLRELLAEAVRDFRR